MKDEILKLIGRQHTVVQAGDAFHLARHSGFTTIDMDMILGLPGEKKEDVAATIETLKKLSPDSLIIHSLAAKRASYLLEWVEEHGLIMKPYYLYR